MGSTSNNHANDYTQLKALVQDDLKDKNQLSAKLKSMSPEERLDVMKMVIEDKNRKLLMALMCSDHIERKTKVSFLTPDFLFDEIIPLDFKLQCLLLLQAKPNELPEGIKHCKSDWCLLINVISKDDQSLGKSQQKYNSNDDFLQNCPLGLTASAVESYPCEKISELFKKFNDENLMRKVRISAIYFAAYYERTEILQDILKEMLTKDVYDDLRSDLSYFISQHLEDFKPSEKAEALRNLNGMIPQSTLSCEKILLGILIDCIVKKAGELEQKENKPWPEQTEAEINNIFAFADNLSIHLKQAPYLLYLREDLFQDKDSVTKQQAEGESPIESGQRKFHGEVPKEEVLGKEQQVKEENAQTGASQKPKEQIKVDAGSKLEANKFRNMEREEREDEQKGRSLQHRGKKENRCSIMPKARKSTGKDQLISTIEKFEFKFPDDLRTKSFENGDQDQGTQYQPEATIQKEATKNGSDAGTIQDAQGQTADKKLVIEKPEEENWGCKGVFKAVGIVAVGVCLVGAGYGVCRYFNLL